MYLSSSFLTYNSLTNSTSFSKFFHNNFRYFIMIIFFIFKIFEWKFNKVKQEQIRFDQASLYKNYPSVKKKASTNIPRNDSFKKKNIVYEENIKTVKGICYICKNKLNDPVAIKSSVYAYCKDCLLDYIEKNKMCPQTELPLLNPDLIKVYL